MGTKKIIKQVLKMKAEGTLPEQLIKTVKTPFGNIDFLVWPMLEYPKPIKLTSEFVSESVIAEGGVADNGIYLHFGIRSDFTTGIASPEITKRPDKYEIRISDLTRNEAEELCDFLGKVIIKV